MVSDGGKGSKARPMSIADEEYSTRWDAIFSRDSQEQALNEMVRISDELGLYDDVYETDKEDDKV